MIKTQQYEETPFPLPRRHPACNGEEVSLTPTYEISVYATKAGYDDSDVTYATIRWRDGRPLFESFSTVEVNQQEASDSNGDGTVDVGDITTIINTMAKGSK